MNKAKKQRLEAAAWSLGDAENFLQLSLEELAEIAFYDAAKAAQDEVIPFAQGAQGLWAVKKEHKC